MSRGKTHRPSVFFSSDFRNRQQIKPRKNIYFQFEFFATGEHPHLWFVRTSPNRPLFHSDLPPSLLMPKYSIRYPPPPQLRHHSARKTPFFPTASNALFDIFNNPGPKKVFLPFCESYARFQSSGDFSLGCWVTEAHSPFTPCRFASPSKI